MVVAWQSGVLREVSYVENIGLGGMYLKTKKPVPVRSLVQVLLDMPVGQVRARGLVRRVRDQQGMGIQIIAMDPEDRARLFQQMRALVEE